MNIFTNLLNSIELFLMKLKNLWFWIPIVYNSYDWDYVYSIRMFVIKLERLSKTLEENNIDEGSLYYSRRINRVAKLLRFAYSLDKDDNTYFKGKVIKKEDYNRASKLAWKIISDEITYWWD